jgi:ankyrin repeat protein
MNDELNRCAGNGNLVRVKELVEGGTNLEDINHDGQTALLLASGNGHFKIVVYLVEHGANIAHTDDDGMTALH